MTRSLLTVAVLIVLIVAAVALSLTSGNPAGEGARDGTARVRPQPVFPESWFFPGPPRLTLKAMEGKPAPELQLATWYGEPQGLEELRGRIVVVDFWATWCQPCMRAIPKNVKLAEEFADEGVLVLGVHDARRGAEKIPLTIDKLGINYPVAVDDAGISTQNWNIQFWPTYFVIDEEGTVRAAGLRPDRVEAVIRMLLDDRA